MDIEDLGKLEFPSNNKEIHLKNRRYHAMPNLDENDECYHKNIPGTQKVHIKTYGCSHNISDSEYMMGLLYDYGYDIVDSIEASDIVIINSCTVKGPSQDAFITYITKSKKLGKAVVVCGCVPQADKNLKGMEECSMLGLTQIDRIIEVVEETLKGNIVSLLQKKDLPSLDLPKIRKNSLIEIVPINMGCLGSCTYCKTKHARGKLISYEPEAIVKACENAWNNGAKEIWITSEDTAVYGRDIGTDLPSLMIKILKDIPKDVMIRIGMANPPYIMEHLDKMVKVLKHPNVYSFIHIPVQAGSNEVLDKMIREYNIEDFSYVCDYFLKKIPEITIATDIICGFPTETKENFEETLDLIKKYKFPVINISQFYPRPGTVAAKMKKVESQEVKRRSTAVANLFKSYENYYHLADTEQLVWFHNLKDEDKNKEQNLMVGHNKSYVKVLVKKDDSLLGKVAKVKVTGINKWHIYGEVIDRNPSLEKVDWETYFGGMIDNNYRPTKVEGNLRIDKKKNYLLRNKEENKNDLDKLFSGENIFFKSKINKEDENSLERKEILGYKLCLAYGFILSFLGIISYWFI